MTTAIREARAAWLDRVTVRVQVSPPRGRHAGAPARLAGPLLLAGLAVLVQALPGAGALLEYHRPAILEGELWRLVTGHWAHASLDHLLWNAATFAVLGGAVAWRSRRLFWATVAASALAISVALLDIAPRWETYRGLSGIDSALFVALAAWLWRRAERRSDRWLGAAALVVLVGKIAFESLTGLTLFTTPTPGHDVVPLAHLAGAASGLAAAALVSATSPRSPARPSSARRSPG